MMHEMTYRVPYADTDQMGVVYYANYLVYFERSRTEMLREAGLAYYELEKAGVYLPVAEANCKYYSPARYDELLTFKSYVSRLVGARLVVSSEVWREETLLVKGYVVLACATNKQKLIRLPQNLIDKCSKYLIEE